MGVKAEEPIVIDFEDLPNYLRAKHSIYMDLGEKLLYLTDANDIYWRAQDTDTYNEKGHYIDCSDLVPTVSEFMDLPVWKGKSIKQLFSITRFYDSIPQ